MEYVDENGDRFDTWVVQRSFNLLIPICRLGVAVLLCFLLLADPLYATQGLWSKNIDHTHLVIWHGAMALFFATFAVIGQRVRTHPSRRIVLSTFIGGSGLMFAWFGVISWIGVGDFSIVAIALLTMAAVFNMPGPLRRVTYVVCTVFIGLTTAWLDTSGKFLGELQFVNLLVIVAVAVAIERFMLQTTYALFVEKCRVAEERRRADSVLYNALPSHVVDELKYTGRVKAQRHENMAVMFADLVGFTSFAASRDPDEVLTLLNTIYSDFDVLAEKHRVEKVKTIGDAYMVASPDAPERLADYSLAIVQAVAEFNRRTQLALSVRIGMHVGATVAGVVGQQRLAYDVWGDAVNLASRMESLSTPGHVHVTDAVVSKLAASHVFEARGSMEVKGKGTIQTFFLRGRKP